MHSCGHPSCYYILDIEIKFPAKARDLRISRVILRIIFVRQKDHTLFRVTFHAMPTEFIEQIRPTLKAHAMLLLIFFSRRLISDACHASLSFSF